MSGVGLHEENLNARAGDLRQASANIEEQVLSPLDEISTISANENSRQAFQGAQSSHQALSAALLDSSQTIKDIGARFFAIDGDAATSWN